MHLWWWGCNFLSQCWSNCADYYLCDPHHKHIFTGDVQIIKNNRTKKFLTKGRNYRATRTINFSKALIEIATALDTWIESMTLKTKYSTSNIKTWKEALLVKVKEKIRELKQKIKPQQAKPVLSDPVFKSTGKNSIDNFLLSPSIKHQAILHSHLENATFPNYWQNLL